MQNHVFKMVAVLMLSGAAAVAGSFTNTFTNPNDTSGFTLNGGTTPLGLPYPAIEAAQGGLVLTYAEASLQGSCVLEDLDAGQPIDSFTAKFKLMLSSGGTADGVSFCFAPEITSSSNFNEEGTGTGIIVEFDTYNNGVPDHIGIDVSAGGVEVGAYPMTQAQINDGIAEDITIQLKQNGTLTVIRGSTTIFDNLYLPGWTPVNGQFAIGARTGGAYETAVLSHLGITTHLAPATPIQPTVTTQPANVSNLAELANATFSVAFDGTAPISLQWQKNGVDIPDATNAVLTLTQVKATDNNAQITCKLSNSAGSVTTAAATLTVNADTTPPTITKVNTDLSFTKVYVKFSEAVTDTSLTKGNYAIDQSVTISGVTRIDASTVQLATSKMAESKTFTLTVNGVQDTAAGANTIAANTKVEFQTFMFWNGSVLHKKYNNVTDGVGATTDGLFTDPRYPSSPDRVDLMTMWEYPANGQGRVAADPTRNYFDTLEGFFIPPSSGNYVFFMAGADRFWLYLSTDESPANVKLIAAQPGGWTNPRNWMTGQSTDMTPCRSDSFTGTEWPDANTISLTAGKRYYMLSVHHDPSWCGADDFGVTYKLDTDADPADNDAPKLTGSNIGTYIDPTGATIDITQQPLAATVQETRTAKLSITATAATAFGTTLFYQWQKNQADIPGATSASYTTPALAMSDNGTKYRCVLTVPGKTVTSAEVAVTVVTDTFPPLVLSAGAAKNQAGAFDVGVQFDEPLSAATAGAMANYTLSAGTISAVNYMSNSPGVILTANGLTAGSKYTVTVKNIADLKGNAITSTNVDFTVGNMTWGVVGSDQSIDPAGTANSLALGFPAGYGVVAVGTNGFDVYSDGIGEWGAYDETTFVYEQVTGNFDKALRVEYQDNSSQWARAGLIAREVTNIGIDRAAQEAGAAGRYQKVHVNPQGPTLTGPGTDGNNNWEGNRRLDAGGGSTTALTYNGRAPVYPNAWCRIVRDGQIFSIYRSDDGKAWTLLGITDWAHASAGGGMADTLYVGPEYTPENGNITQTADRGRFVAKMRDYGNSTSLTTADSTVSKRKVVFLGSAKFTSDKGGHSGAAGDYALDLGNAGDAMAQVTDPTFLNAATANDEMSVSLWIKRNDINNSSAFWIRSRQNPVSTDTPGNSDRAFQAHVPWSDNNIVFDTVGCCDATTQRISKSATGAAGYTDLGWWTNHWHHFVFTKKADQKNIYIDGQLFLNGSSSNPLPIDIGEFMIGAETSTANGMHGKIDDLAVFGKELTLTQANSLFTGAAPSSLTTAQLLAFWNFNDAPAIAVGPTLSWVKTSMGMTITYTGTLQSVDAIKGSWGDVNGATSPYTVTPSKTAQFFRARQ